MRITKILQCLLFASLCFSLPGQAAMVGTAEFQADLAQVNLGDITSQRNWIREQLITGGVEADAAAQRVAAMTDLQVQQLHQRIEEHPAGGNALIFILVVLLITELSGVTDIIPAIRPLD